MVISWFINCKLSGQSWRINCEFQLWTNSHDLHWLVTIGNINRLHHVTPMVLTTVVVHHGSRFSSTRGSPAKATGIPDLTCLHDFLDTSTHLRNPRIVPHVPGYAHDQQWTLTRKDQPVWRFNRKHVGFTCVQPFCATYNIYICFLMNQIINIQRWHDSNIGYDRKKPDLSLGYNNPTDGPDILHHFLKPQKSFHSAADSVSFGLTQVDFIFCHRAWNTCGTKCLTELVSQQKPCKNLVLVGSLRGHSKHMAVGQNTPCWTSWVVHWPIWSSPKSSFIWNIFNQ